MSPIQDPRRTSWPARGDPLPLPTRPTPPTRLSRPRRAAVVATATALLAPLLTVAALGAPAQAAGTGAGPQGRHHPPHHQRVGYFTQWGIYGADFRIKDLVSNGSAARLTTLNYAFGNVTADGVCTEAAAPAGLADPWADYQVGFTAEQSVDGVADTPE